MSLEVRCKVDIVNVFEVTQSTTEKIIGGAIKEGRIVVDDACEISP